MSRRALKMVLLCGVLIGCGSNSEGTGTGGAGGHGTGGHGTGGSATGGHIGTGTGGATGGTAGGTAGAAGGTGGTAGAAGGHAGGSGGSAGGGGAVVTGTGGTAGGSGGHAGGGGSATGGTAGGSGGHAGSAGGAGGGAAGAAGSAGGAAGGQAGAAGGAAGGHAGSAGGAAGGHAGAAGGAAGGATGGGGVGGGVGGMGGDANAAVTRGEYLVTKVFNCGGCHTPSGAGAMALSGRDCLVGSATTGPDCLSSANLTNDATAGLKNLTNQQIKDAFTKGKDPDVAGKYLFNTMPYYQYANLTDDDANAIVAYLRTVPASTNVPHDNTGAYATQPSAPQNAAVNPADLPPFTSATGAANGKYLATLVCVTCHTIDLPVVTPTLINAAHAFEGGRMITSGTSTGQSANITPDATGIMGWSATDVATVVTTGKYKSNGNTMCGMRANGMTTADATDIGTYLLGIPAAASTVTKVCAH